MFTLAVRTARTDRRVQWSLLAFRIFAAVVALLFIIVISLWRKVLMPWFPYGEAITDDFGWVRHSELFLIPDTAAAAFQFALGIAALILAIRPRGRSAMVTWLAGGILLIAWAGMFTAHFAGTSLIDTTIQGLVLTVGLCVPLVMLHPQRRDILRGGAVGVDPAPSRLLRIEMAIFAIAGSALAVGSVVWRAGGGVFENPREDSVLSLVMFGLVLAFGAVLCGLGREGWKDLAWILNALVAYSALALLTIAFT